MGLLHGYFRLKHLYNSLSNRVLGVILLFLIIFSLFIFYWYIFIYSLHTVSLSANVDNYKVSLYSKEIKKTYNFDCLNKKCDLRKISGFDYNIIISKKGYNNFIFSFNPKIEKEFSFELTKEIILKKIEDEIEQEKDLSRKEKIDLIKKKNNNFLFLKNKKGEFIFKELNNKLEFYFNGKKISVLNKVSKDKIVIKDIINSKNHLFLKLGEKKYLINLVFLNLTEIDIKLDINYIKELNDSTLLFITEKGSFLYNVREKQFNYFNLLFDFVILPNGNYIGVLKDKNDIQKSNLDFEKQKGDIIISYNLKDKKAELLKNTGFIIDKIYLNNNVLKIESDNIIYELLNY